MDKNTTYTTNGNESADQLLYSLENSMVISDHFKSRIKAHVIRILTTNYKGDHTRDMEDEIRKEIMNLVLDMQYSKVLSDWFVTYVKNNLILALDYEVVK